MEAVDRTGENRTAAGLTVLALPAELAAPTRRPVAVARTPVDSRAGQALYIR